MNLTDSYYQGLILGPDYAPMVTRRPTPWLVDQAQQLDHWPLFGAGGSTAEVSNSRDSGQHSKQGHPDNLERSIVSCFPETNDGNKRHQPGEGNGI